MLVRVQPGTGTAAHGLSGAEAKVHDLLAGWAHGTDHAIGGLALLNINIPDKRTTRQVDGLLFLPTALAVLEVKGFTAPQSGTLAIPPNGPWLVDGQPAAIHTLAGLPNPGEQVKAGVYGTKRAFAGIPGGDGFVRGLVVLVPRPASSSCRRARTWPATASTSPWPSTAACARSCTATAPSPRPGPSTASWPPAPPSP